MFFSPESPAFVAAAPFEAIFCKAVLQRSENRSHARAIAYPGFLFQRFEEQLQKLDRKLQPGGLLFVDQADFSVLDTSLAANYRALEFVGSRVRRQRPVFGPDNRLRATEYIADRCFLKLPAPNNVRP